MDNNLSDVRINLSAKEIKAVKLRLKLLRVYIAVAIGLGAFHGAIFLERGGVLMAGMTLFWMVMSSRWWEDHNNYQVMLSLSGNR